LQPPQRDDTWRTREVGNGTTQLIEEYLDLLDDALVGPNWRSALSKLNTVAPEDWDWAPPGAERSICDLVRHLGCGKIIARDHAIGGGTLTWDDVGGGRER